MKVHTVLIALFFEFAYSRYMFAHGFDLARISSQPPKRSSDLLSTLERNIQPTTITFRKQFGTLVFKNLPSREPRRYFPLLSSKIDDFDESADDSVGASDDTGNQNNPMNLVLGTKENTTAVIDRQDDGVISDFLYGANYVHSQYLSLFWRYSIMRGFVVTMPIGIALWITKEYGLYDLLFRALRSVYFVSSFAGDLLLPLPLELARSLILDLWNNSPEALAASISILPNSLAIPVVQILLLMRTFVVTVVEACCGNNVIASLFSMVAIFVWRPALEELQYRSILNKLLSELPRWAIARGRLLLRSAIVMMQRINFIGQNFTGKIGILKNETFTSSDVTTASVQPEVDISMTKRITTVKETDGNSTIIAASLSNEDEKGAYDPFLPNESTRILLGSLLYGTTRLGWLWLDMTDSFSLSNSSYGFTIGFLGSIWSMLTSGGGVNEVRHGLRIFVLLLAIHQTVSSFFIAQHVFAPIYRQRGLVASMGAHVSWTIGKLTITFRLLWKVWQCTYAGVWSTSYGSSLESKFENDDMDSNTSQGDGDGE